MPYKLHLFKNTSQRKKYNIAVMLYYGIIFVTLVVGKNSKCNDYYLPCHYHHN